MYGSGEWKPSLSPRTMILWMWMNWISGRPSLTTTIWILLARNPNSPVVFQHTSSAHIP